MTESYHGTRGHSGGDASKDAAVAERNSGKTNEMMREVYREVSVTHQVGITSAELRAIFPDEHHGRITSALTKLHIAGKIVALRERRGNCGVYVAPQWVGEREVRPYRRQNVRLQVEDVQALLREHRPSIAGCRCGHTYSGPSLEWTSWHRHHLAEVIVALSRGEL